MASKMGTKIDKRTVSPLGRMILSQYEIDVRGSERYLTRYMRESILCNAMYAAMLETATFGTPNRPSLDDFLDAMSELRSALEL